MKRLAVIRVRKEPVYRRAAIETGLKRAGFTLTERDTPAGIGDVLCLWNRKRGTEENLADAWERLGGTVLVVENGYLQKVDKTMYAISIGQHHTGHHLPYDESVDRFSRLGFTLKPWQDNPAGHRLVCAQRGIGSTLMASPPQWAEKTVKKLQGMGVPNVRLRPHPGNHVAKVPLEHDLKGAHSCIIWSSNVGVRALVEGIPVQHSAPNWICAGAGPECRELILNRMAHSQWSVAEIETGEPFARMAAHNWRVVW